MTAGWAPPPAGHLTLEAGITVLPGVAREVLVAVPPDQRRRARIPVLVMLHGAGGSARGALDLVAVPAAALGIVVVAPSSQGRTWDLIEGGFGVDVEHIDDVLGAVAAAVSVDPALAALGGFSDGASYALSLGLGNGDVFPNLVAFSPGFAVAPPAVGSPRVWASHGVHDRVLPIDRCSRRLVPALRARGLAVEHHEFDGGHVVPADLAAQALAWLVG